MKKQATCVYLTKGDKVLFLVRQKEGDDVHKQGIYLPIGGKVETGEEIETCARREVKEESGVTVRSLDLRGIVYTRGQNTGKYDWMLSIFLSSDFSGEPRAGNEGYFEWVDLKDIPRLAIYEGDKIYFEYLRKYNFFVADFLYKGFELQAHKLLKHF